MLEIAGAPLLDKQTLIGGYVRLPVAFDAARFAADIAALPAGLWGTTGGRVGVHRIAEGIFLRGYAPAEGERPIEDRPALASLPCARSADSHRNSSFSATPGVSPRASRGTGCAGHGSIRWQ